MPLHQFVLEHAARFGDRPALVDGPTGRALTYRQLAAASGTTGLPKGWS